MRGEGEQVSHGICVSCEGAMLEEDYYVLECDVRPTVLGEALRVQIHRWDMKPMGWAELWSVFSAKYPGKWAFQMFPPYEVKLDQANKYHLFVFDQEPTGLNLFEDPPKGSRRPPE
jgi:hypothetical protein